MTYIIGLCGHPKSGKSEVQRILMEKFGVIAVDDGACLREFAMQNLGLTWDDVYTQEGKAAEIEVAGEVMQVRQFLGRLGNAIEDEFGQQIIPEIARTRAEANDYMLVSFGSVRKMQGLTVRQNGMMIEVQRPGVGPSGNDFDWFDPTLVDITIENTGTIEDLEMSVQAIIGPIVEKLRP